MIIIIIINIGLLLVKTECYMIVQIQLQQQ